MGGCKCSYNSCQNSTTTNNKLHFFHFPTRDSKRCEQWIINSGRTEFHSLPLDKLHNKVLCEDHFEEKSFMNCKRNRLTIFAIPKKYSSVPELQMAESHVNTDNDIDFTFHEVESPMIENVNSSEFVLVPSEVNNDLTNFIIVPVNNKKSEIKTEYKYVPKITNVYELQSNFPQQKRNIMQYENFRQKDIKIEQVQEMQQSQVFSMTKDGQLDLISVSESTKVNTELFPQKMILHKNREESNSTVYSICAVSNNELKINEYNEEIILPDSTIDFISNENITEQIQHTNSEESRTLRSEKENHYIDFRRKQKQKKSNEFILKRAYNIIRKHVTPVLATALRKELFEFGSNNEKTSALEIYNTSPEAYSVMIKQGWPLPPVETVEEWLLESSQLYGFTD